MRICVVGLGIIGRVWAEHLVADGHAVTTWNRTPKPDAPGWTPDLATAAHGAELVMIVVADPPAVAAVLERLTPSIGTLTTVAQHSTIGVSDTRAAATAVRARGGRFIDMPFTGSKPAAEQRQNVFFVGDDDGSLARVEEVYRRLGKALLPIGRVGQAMAIKLSFNLLIAGLNQAMVESMELARRSGIANEAWFDALEHNVARSRLVDLKKAKWLAGDWSPQFSIKHLAKDLRLALDLARTKRVDLAATRAVVGEYTRAEQMGMGELDFAAMLQLVRGEGT